MKKIVALTALALCAVLLFASCASKNENVKLGDYKGIEVTLQDGTVTDEDVEKELQSVLQSNATAKEVTGRAVESGDTVNIDYEGLMDGVAFEGGTAKAQDLTIGSGQFIAGFEDGLIGANIGDKKTLNLSFPDPYTLNPDFSGKAVVFNVTVNSIRTMELPELNDTFIQSISQEHKTVDEYRAYLKSNLEQQMKDEVENDKISQLKEKIVAGSEILNYPQDQIDAYIKDMRAYYEEYAAAYQMEFTKFIETYYQMTEDDFNTEAQTMAKQAVAETLVIDAIAKAENITLSDEEYAKLKADYTKEYGFESEEKFLEYYGGEETVRKNMLADKVMDFVAENAKIV